MADPHENEALKQDFLLEAHASWAHYQATKLHLTGDEARAWLEGWGEDERGEAPTCHT